MPERSRAPAAVLWDLDGTLVDTSSVWWLAYEDLAARWGRRLTPSAWPRLAGRTIVDSVVQLRDELGLAVSPAVEEDTRWLVARAGALVAARAPLPWRPGAERALAVVRDAGIPTALVTSSWRAMVSVVLARLGTTFDAVVCGDEVAVGKPAPDAYRCAAGRLGVPIEACVAVEDSPTGAAAAEAAGARVLVVPSSAPLPPAPGRTVRRSLEDVTLATLAHTGRTCERGDEP